MNFQQSGISDSRVSELPPGWTEGSPGGIATNRDPASGGIIDRTIADGTWFVVFHRDDLEVLHDLPSRQAAFEAFARAMATPQQDLRHE
ncbi:hypothetical protein [Paraburkholderia youngii]|uniref:hypothetical protein n=1 Tax=Paraburkholderia youngii TaxID=2782701 RepID=UPI003D25BE8E